MARLLMPKATAVWLVENTCLTFEQIASFTGLHVMEIQSIADGDVPMQGWDPVHNNQLSRDEVRRCEADPEAPLISLTSGIPDPKRQKGPRYIPLSKRGDKPDAIAWLLKFHTELNNSNIKRLIGTTAQTIDAIRSRSHWNIQAIRPRHPVELGLCNQKDIDDELVKALAQLKKTGHGQPDEVIPNPFERTPAAEVAVKDQ